MSKVYFIEGKNDDFLNGKIGEAVKALDKLGFKDFGGKNVLVKLHMGEINNKFFVDPMIIKPFVDALQKMKAKPFLFDTLAKYPRARHTKELYLKTAIDHGFEKVGCPIIIGNEGSSIGVKVDSGTYGFEVAKELCDVECVLSIAHGKGHGMAGFGGSIKAFGMGGVSRESKVFIHTAGAPVMKNKEECAECGACAEACPMGLIKVKGGWTIDYSKCGGCEKCVRACPKGLLFWKEEEFELMLAAAARACLNESGPKNRPKKKIFVNVLTKISRYCDCAPDAGPIICPDIGILISEDPVAIDAASIDLIEKKMGKSLKEIQNADPRLHVKRAEELRMGEMKYELVKLLQ